MHNTDDRSFWESRIAIEMSIVQAMALHGNICLAMRHPQNNNQLIRNLMMQVIYEIGGMLVRTGALTEDERNYAERTEIENYDNQENQRKKEELRNTLIMKRSLN